MNHQLRKLLAAPATSTQAVVVLPAGTATQLAAANPARRTLAVVNIGTNPATMGFANTVVAGQGWPLAAANAAGGQGGGFEWPAQAVHGGAVWAVSAAGTSIVVLEG
jgi:hypothetical protein